jgi:hypothetical protein
MERFRRPVACSARLNPPARKVIQIPRAPRRLFLPPTRSLARRLTAGALSGTYSIVGTEPTMADTTRTLSGNRHDDSSSARLAEILSGNLDYRTGGSIPDSIPCSILKSAEAQLNPLYRMFWRTTE